MLATTTVPPTTSIAESAMMMMLIMEADDDIFLEDSSFSCDQHDDGDNYYMSAHQPLGDVTTTTSSRSDNEVIRLCNAGVALLEQPGARHSEAANSFWSALGRVEANSSSSIFPDDPAVDYSVMGDASTCRNCHPPPLAEQQQQRERADPSSYIYEREDYDEGMYVFHEALSLSAANSQWEQQLILRYNLGQASIRCRQYHTARRWFQTAWNGVLAESNATTTTTTELWTYHLSVRLLHNLGFCSYCLGQNETALQWYQESLRIVDHRSAKNHDEHFALQHNKKQRLDETHHHHQQQQQQQLDRAATHNCIAVLLFHRSSTKNNDTAEALNLLQSSLSTYQTFQQHNNNNNDSCSRSIATCLGNMGRIYFLTSDHDRALRSFRKAYHLRQQLFGDNVMDTAAMLFNYGQSLQYRGSLEQALGAYREFLRVARHYGSSHFQRDVCAVLRAMAQVQRQRAGLLAETTTTTESGSKQEPSLSSNNMMAEACALLREAFGVGCGALGSQAKEANCILSELGSLYAERQEYEKSIDCFREFLFIQEDIFGAKDPLHANIIITKINLARVCKHSGDYAAAFRYYKEVHAMQVQLDKTCGATSGASEGDAERSHSSSLESASTLSSMGLMLYLMQAFQASLDCYQEALRIRLDKLGTNHHPDVAENINSVGLVLYKLGFMDMAKEAFQECIKLRTQLTRKEVAAASTSDASPLTTTTVTSNDVSASSCAMAESKEIAVLLFNIATACMQNGEDDQGIKWYNESLRVERKILGNDHPEVGVTLKHIARVHEDRGDFHLAITFLHQALAISTSNSQQRNRSGCNEEQGRCKSGVETLRRIGNLHYMLAEVPQMMACFAKAERFVGNVQAGMNLDRTEFLSASAGNLYGLSKLHPPASALA